MIRLSEAIARANCTSEVWLLPLNYSSPLLTSSEQITPAFVREAYSLLRQSIIHVEQDDIDFDEEELEGERGDTRPAAAPAGADDIDEYGNDVEMSAAEMEAMDEMEASSLPVPALPSTPAAPGSPGSTGGAEPSEPAPAAPKRRMIITHDQYMTLQSLIIFRITEVERESGTGVDREDLVDWYLEKKESGFVDAQDVEYETELITKMLRKLVKVSFASFYNIAFWLMCDCRRTI
jgi:DNA replication licensing factor MCM6